MATIKDLKFADKNFDKHTELEKNKIARKQANPKAGKGGIVPPKEYQFGQPNGNPRHNGAWKKEDTPRFKLEQMMKMEEEELDVVLEDAHRPYFEKKIAKCIVDGDWKTLESMINQVYGQPKATNETVISGELTQKTNPYEGFTKEELKELLKK